MKRYYCWLWLWLLIACTAYLQTAAQMTPAGTEIRLQATASYTDASGNTYTATSNEVVLTVAQVAGVEVTLPTRSATLNPGGSYYFPATIKNTGNGNDFYHLYPYGLPNGWTAQFVEDTNGNGQHDANENNIIDRTPTLPMGNEYKIFVKVTAPPGTVTSTTVQSISFEVKSDFDSTKIAQNTLTADVVNPFQPLWTVTVPGGIPGDVTIAGDRIFVGSGTGKLYAYWANSTQQGTEAWSSPVELGAAMTGRVSAWGSTLFVPTGDGRVHLVDIHSGTVLGTRTVSSGTSIVASPIVQAGILFVPAQDGRLRAFGSDGNLIAESAPMGTEFASTPSAPGTTHLWVGTGLGTVACFRSQDLALVWEEMVSPGVPVTSSPWIDLFTNRMFIGAQNGLFFAFRATSDVEAEHILWVYDARSPIKGSPFYDWIAQVVYFGTEDGKIHAVHADSGTPRTGYPIQPREAGKFLGMPIVVRKMGSSTPYIYIGSDNGKFYAINADNPQEFYLYDGSNQNDSFVRSPSISGLSEGDVIVAVSTNGKVLAFPLK